MKFWPAWLSRRLPAISRNSADAPGTCQICGANAIIWLDGREFFCWDHYAEEMQGEREKS